MHETTLALPVPPPFRLDATAWVLRRRPKNLIDRWDGRYYCRVLIVGGAPVKVTASLEGDARAAPRLAVRLQSRTPLGAARRTEVTALLHKMLGLAVDTGPFYALAARRPELRQLAGQFTGVRPTRFPSVFEALVNAVACQQVSLDAGLALLNRLSETFGPGFADGTAIMHAFPEPADLLDVAEGDLKQLGFSYQKARALKEIAYRVASGEVDDGRLECADDQTALAALQAIRGIGRWSAEYVLLRGLGRLNVFPGDDVGGQNNIRALLGLAERPGYEQLRDLAAGWQPYAGFVYFHLLLGKLHEKGLV